MAWASTIGAIDPQLGLPFTDAEPARHVVSAWIIACRDDDPNTLIADLRRGKTIFVDSRTGEVPICPHDVLLVRRTHDPLYSILAADGRAGASLVPDGLSDQFRTPAGAAQLGRVQNIISVSFTGDDHLIDTRPVSDIVGLERTFSTVRHSVLDAAPGARMREAQTARRALDGVGHPAVLGVINREIADAARTLYLSHRDPAARDVGLDAHLRAETALRRAGLKSQADDTASRLQQWLGDAQLELDLFAGPPKPLSAGARIGYSTRRLLAHRFPIRSAIPPSGHTSALVWKPVIEASIPDSVICSWVSGLTSRHLLAFHRWATGNAAELLLEIGLDADFPVLLGLAGHTGGKDGTYTLKAWGRGYEIKPDIVECRVGQPARLAVRFLDGPRSSGLDIELFSGTGERVPLRIPVPDGL